MYDNTNIFAEYPDVVNTTQFREMLPMGKNKMYDLLNSGEIPSIKIGVNGRTRYILKQEIISYLNRKTIHT